MISSRIPSAARAAAGLAVPLTRAGGRAGGLWSGSVSALSPVPRAGTPLGLRSVIESVDVRLAET